MVDDLCHSVVKSGSPNPVRASSQSSANAMVVIDEAHNLRNPATQRADALRRLLQAHPPNSSCC